MNIYTYIVHEMETAENSKLVKALDELNGAFSEPWKTPSGQRL